MKALRHFALWSMFAFIFAACGGGDGGSGGGGGGGAGGGGGGGASTLQAEIDRLFPFTPNQPFDVTFICGRMNSRLAYYFDFNLDQTFNVYITLDNHQDVTFSGTYTYTNGVIHMTALDNPILPLDEMSTRIAPHLGLVGEFETPNMRCGAQGHGYNDAALDTFKSYSCPIINIGPASDEENAFEFVHSAIPFNFAVPGSIFRQRDVNVSGNNQPIVTRGYGIYRRVGNTFYADFGNQFSDHNLLKGTFGNNDQQISVEQLEPARGACKRR
ncbi:MAG TPA: hypothetical protein VFR86_23135 [Burkholderiaceae bacterium]|nr:hypothetical protein [Burkholderiaceae bacterium]